MKKAAKIVWELLVSLGAALSLATFLYRMFK